jgi:hypothetical protein
VLREHEHVSAGEWDVRKDGMRGKGKKECGRQTGDGIPRFLFVTAHVLAMMFGKAVNSYLHLQAGQVLIRRRILR